MIINEGRRVTLRTYANTCMLFNINCNTWTCAPGRHPLWINKVTKKVKRRREQVNIGVEVTGLAPLG